jgi:AmmeMemoRadiSam system protein A
MLSEAERLTLLTVARSAVEAAIRDVPSDPPTDVPENLLQPAGVFVTLRIRGDLRGCIGYIESHDPLIETVRDAAAKAALTDFRFAPLTSAELSSLGIEISVLSPVTPVKDITGIEVGKHGLIIEQGHRRGLLLPQVPLEYGWDREEFLSYTARKAGLPPNAWKDPASSIFSFTAEVFDEARSLSGRPA